MSTKREAYEAEMTDMLRVLDVLRVDPNQARRFAVTVRSYVAELQEALKASAELKVETVEALVAAKDAEIAELRGQVGRMLDHSSELKARQHELEQQLAAAKAEAEKWERLAKEFQAHSHGWESERDKLIARIESAPKVWLWWCQAPDGEWFVYKASPKEDEWRGITMDSRDRVECVRAVPVEEK